jgi:hypothetical protein
VLIADLPPISIGWAFRHWKHLSPPARDFVHLVHRELAKLRRVRGFELMSEPATPAA